MEREKGADSSSTVLFFALLHPSVAVDDVAVDGAYRQRLLWIAPIAVWIQELVADGSRI